MCTNIYYSVFCGWGAGRRSGERVTQPKFNEYWVGKKVWIDFHYLVFVFGCFSLCSRAHTSRARALFRFCFFGVYVCSITHICSNKRRCGEIEKFPSFGIRQNEPAQSEKRVRPNTMKIQCKKFSQSLSFLPNRERERENIDDYTTTPVVMVTVNEIINSLLHSFVCLIDG